MGSHHATLRPRNALYTAPIHHSFLLEKSLQLPSCHHWRRFHVFYRSVRDMSTVKTKKGEKIPEHLEPLPFGTPTSLIVNPQRSLSNHHTNSPPVRSGKRFGKFGKFGRSQEFHLFIHVAARKVRKRPHTTKGIPLRSVKSFLQRRDKNVNIPHDSGGKDSATLFLSLCLAFLFGLFLHFLILFVNGFRLECRSGISLKLCIIIGEKLIPVNPIIVFSGPNMIKISGNKSGFACRSRYRRDIQR